VEEFFALICFVVMLIIYLKARSTYIGPLDFFVFFFVIQYGPQTIILPDLQNWDPVLWGLNPDWVHEEYYWMMAVSYLSVGAGFSLGGVLSKKFLPGSSAQVRYRSSNWFYPFCFFYISLFFFVDAGFLVQKLIGVTDYFRGSSELTYRELRYESLSIFAAESLVSQTRYTLTAVMFGLLVCKAWNGLAQGFLATATAILMFTVCVLSFSKLAYLYYIAIILIIVKEKTSGWAWGAIRFRMLFFSAFWAFVLLSGLLYLQYREAIHSPQDALAVVGTLLLYRPFFATADSLSLYVYTYPDYLPYTGFGGIGKLADLLGLEYREAALEVPLITLQSIQTSFPAGFIGSGYSAAGIAGVSVSGLITGYLVRLLSNMAPLFRSLDFRAVFLAVTGLSTFFLSAIPLHTALLSGGVVIGPFFLYLLQGLFSVPVVDRFEQDRNPCIFRRT
jgi:hypothetical protein